MTLIKYVEYSVKKIKFENFGHIVRPEKRRWKKKSLINGHHKILKEKKVAYQ